jgi:hypothetical protein
MGFKLKKIFKLKNLLKAAALAAAVYTGGAALGAWGGAAGAGGAAAGAGAGSALGSLGSGALKLGSGIANVAGKASSLMTAASMLQKAPKPQMTAVEPQESPFMPVRPGLFAAPPSLSDMAGMDDLQKRTNLATRGVQGGLGQEEEQYFNNMVQRTLLDENNSVGNIDRLTPIELQYYRKKGYNADDPTQLLRSLQRG